MYQAVTSFLSRYAPRRQLSDVYVAATDGFFDQPTLKVLGLVNARFITDRAHLMVLGGLEKFFGKALHGKIGHQVRKMVTAQDKMKFDEAKQAATEVIKSTSRVDGDALVTLNTFAELKDTYSDHCLKRIPFSGGRKGSSCSEVNHSSVLAHLNERQGVTTNSYRESGTVLVRDLLLRQNEQVKKRNVELFAESQRMRVELERLKGQPDDDERVSALRQAAEVLSLPFYERFKKNYDETDYFSRLMVRDGVTGKERCEIRSIKNPDAAPFVFESFNQRCLCDDHVMNQDMCTHEILHKKGFHAPFFLEMHMRRNRVGGSLIGWVPPTKSVDDLLDIMTETIEDQPVMLGSADENAHAIRDMPKLQEEKVARPVGYLPDHSHKVQPLPKTQIENILTTAVAMYGRCSNAEKFRLSTAALDMQNIMTTKEDARLERVQHDDLHVAYPSTVSLRKDPPERLKGKKEQSAGSKLARAREVVGKVDKQLQRAGIAQIVQASAGHGSENVLANGKSLRKCGFCKVPGCSIYTCKKRIDFVDKGKEYVLTHENPGVETMLKERIIYSMPFRTTEVTDTVFGKLSHWLYKRNLIIHEAKQSTSGTVTAIEQIDFCVSLVGKNGLVIEHSKRIWVTGKVVNGMITHTLKTRKYVYDQTAKSNPSAREIEHSTKDGV